MHVYKIISFSCMFYIMYKIKYIFIFVIAFTFFFSSSQPYISSLFLKILALFFFKSSSSYADDYDFKMRRYVFKKLLLYYESSSSLSFSSRSLSLPPSLHIYIYNIDVQPYINNNNSSI